MGTRADKKYSTAMHAAAKYLMAQVSEGGYISAAPDYYWYKPHWIRDSSWIAISLIRYAHFSKKTSPAESKKSLDTANRILGNNIALLESRIGGIRNTIGADLKDPQVFLLKNNIPARVGPDKKMYVDARIDDSGEEAKMHSWLMQHDSVPLVILTIREKMRSFELDAAEKKFLKEYTDDILSYLGKTYMLECPNAWEIRPDMIHSYNVGAIHAAFAAMDEFSEKGVITVGQKEIRAAYEKFYNGGPLNFLIDRFMRDGIIYGSMSPNSKNPDTEKGMDAALVYFFTEFGLGSNALGPDVEAKMIKAMEDTLFSGNVLPIRFPKDTYFSGGRWLLLGLAFADYYARKGDTPKAKAIIDYVIDKYAGSYPEQELVNPASEEDPDHYYERLGNKTIQNLAWSHASLIIAIISLLDKG